MWIKEPSGERFKYIPSAAHDVAVSFSIIMKGIGVYWSAAAKEVYGNNVISRSRRQRQYIIYRKFIYTPC